MILSYLEIQQVAKSLRIKMLISIGVKKAKTNSQKTKMNFKRVFVKNWLSTKTIRIFLKTSRTTEKSMKRVPIFSEKRAGKISTRNLGQTSTIGKMLKK